jgi:hypothetical protein
MTVCVGGLVRDGYEMVENMCCSDVCSGTMNSLDSVPLYTPHRLYPIPSFLPHPFFPS